MNLSPVIFLCGCQFSFKTGCPLERLVLRVFCPYVAPLLVATAPSIVPTKPESAHLQNVAGWAGQCCCLHSGTRPRSPVASAASLSPLEVASCPSGNRVVFLSWRKSQSRDRPSHLYQPKTLCHPTPTKEGNRKQCQILFAACSTLGFGQHQILCCQIMVPLGTISVRAHRSDFNIIELLGGRAAEKCEKE